ncbi:hypothetical protein HK099_004773 [Clydaea vesicula]|uniref:Mediator of RNA polymerase II transcription subunit 17 n=1 Tax=Clydaea vesicula TaxID=447962 RepID=A0AAD5U390_9FUNG|nr:hypothetical protein HK099_004773 [Clydaea vesicula]
MHLSIERLDFERDLIECGADGIEVYETIDLDKVDFDLLRNSVESLKNETNNNINSNNGTNNKALKPPIINMKDLIYMAREELILSSDVLNRLIQGENILVTLANAKPEQTDISKINNSKLILNSKIQHLLDSQKFFIEAQSRLKNSLKIENDFYSNYCLHLFNNNWFIQGLPDKKLILDYSYKNAGSTFSENGIAEIIRDISGNLEEVEVDSKLQENKKTNLFLPHTRNKRVTIQKFGNFDMELSRDEGLFWDIWEKECKKSSPVLRQLSLAQSVIYELELFEMIQREAIRNEQLSRNSFIRGKSITLQISSTEIFKFKLTPIKKNNEVKAKSILTDIDQSKEVKYSEKVLEEAFFELISRKKLRRFHKEKNKTKESSKSGCDIINDLIKKYQFNTINKRIQATLFKLCKQFTEMEKNCRLTRSKRGESLFWDFKFGDSIFEIELNSDMVIYCKGKNGSFKVYNEMELKNFLVLAAEKS